MSRESVADSDVTKPARSGGSGRLPGRFFQLDASKKLVTFKLSLRRRSESDGMAGNQNPALKAPDFGNGFVSVKAFYSN